jgi:hypothetical protein
MISRCSWCWLPPDHRRRPGSPWQGALKNNALTLLLRTIQCHLAVAAKGPMASGAWATKVTPRCHVGARRETVRRSKCAVSYGRAALRRWADGRADRTSYAAESTLRHPGKASRELSEVVHFGGLVVG